jgi:hypothetical protein
MCCVCLQVLHFKSQYSCYAFVRHKCRFLSSKRLAASHAYTSRECSYLVREIQPTFQIYNHLTNFQGFNVFHVPALYYTKNFKHQQMHNEFFLVNYNTLLHV